MGKCYNYKGGEFINVENENLSYKISRYSDGFMGVIMGKTRTRGFGHLGHSVFLRDRGDHQTLAHEMTHGRQLVEAGGPVVFYKRYSKYSNPFNPNDPGYATNPYEIEARYYGWGYGEGLDLYGRGYYDIGVFRNRHKDDKRFRYDPGPNWKPFTKVY